MIRLRHKMLIRATRLLDLTVLVATALAVISYQAGPRGLVAVGSRNFVVESVGMLVLALGWVVVFDHYVRYRADRFVEFQAQLRNLIKATTVAAIWLLVISALLLPWTLELGEILIFWGVVSVIGVAIRIGLKGVLMGARRSGYNYRYLLIVGANRHAAEFAGKISQRPELGYKIVGFIAESAEAERAWAASSGRVIGTIDEIRNVLEDERVDEMLVCLSVETKFRTVSDIIAIARDLGIVLRIAPEAAEGAMLEKLHIEEFENEYVVTLFREQMLVQLLVKRLVDVLVSLIALGLLSVGMAAVAVLIKLTSPGPVLFTQDRVGMNQRTFRLYKFRSMVVDADERKRELEHLNEVDGPVFKIGNDPRITRIGRFIRRTSIDELPQLFNVLRGEMSLVGPRPPLPDEVRNYQWMFRKRLSVKPGITCVWQVSGRNQINFERWMQMDHDYIENWSLWLDFKILLKTIPAVFLGRGAS
jgi:exopolysaccharide biosynthesis polyprenyl glycosylphosphotransferase